MLRRSLLAGAVAGLLLAACSGSVLVKPGAPATGSRPVRLLLATDLRETLGEDLGLATEAALRDLLAARGLDPVQGQWPGKLALERTDEALAAQAQAAGRDTVLAVQSARMLRTAYLSTEETFEARLVNVATGAAGWRGEIVYKPAPLPFAGKGDGRRLAEEIVQAMIRDQAL